MDHPADSTAKLCQGGKGTYVDREGIPMDDSSGKECEPIIVFEPICGVYCESVTFPLVSWVRCGT